MTAVAPAIYADKVLRRFQFTLILVIAVLVIGVAAAAFFTSFEAIRDYAAKSGGINPEHAWLVPLLVDSFIAIAQLADLWFTTSGAARRAQGRTKHAIVWSPKLLLALAAGASFALNVAHAEHTGPARAVAAIAPIALVVTFEILMAVVRWAVAARVERFGAEQPTWREQDVARVIRRAVAAVQTTTSEAGGRRSRQVGQEREAGPTTTPPAPAASPPRVRPRSNREVEAPAPGGGKSAATRSRVATAASPTTRGRGAPDLSGERALLIRSQLAEDINRSTRQIKTALGSAGPGMVGDSKALAALVEEIRSEMKQESNGVPERVEVRS